MIMQLQELARNKNWVRIELSHSRVKTSPDAITIAFNRSHIGKPVNRIVIRLGENVQKLLNIKAGDKVNVFNHPDDYLSFMIIKSTSNAGITASRENKKSLILKVSIIWKFPLILEVMPSTVVEYLHITQNNSIVFRLPS
jgi:hypothetical protein